MKKVWGSLFALLWAISVNAQKTDIKNIAIYLQDNVEILDFAGPMEVFIVAGYNVYTVAKTTKPMKAMHYLTVVPDYSMDNAPTPDIVVFVGGGDINAAKDQEVKDWVKKVTPKSQLSLTVCTGAFFLAEAGFLDSKIATTYHKSIDYLQSEYPNIDVRKDVRFVDNGKVITTAGISAGIDGALHMVSKLKGEKFALEVAKGMEYDKWIPEEGLILQYEKLNKSDERDIKKFLNENLDDLYPGEILNLSSKLNDMGMYSEAEKAIKYVISTMSNPDVDTYEFLRENYILQNKEVPMTSQQFIDIIRDKGAKLAEKTFVEQNRIFRDWVFVNPDDIIMYGYTDHFLKGKVESAFEIQKLAKKIFPEDAYVTYVLGVYHEKEGHAKLAVNYYREALQYDSNFAMAKEKLDALVEQEKL
ncbi:MAG: DJ-1/PfpI family protein [Bacteroidota bacterium]